MTDTQADSLRKEILKALRLIPGFDGRSIWHKKALIKLEQLLAAHERALLDSLLEHKHKLHSLHQCVPVSVIQAKRKELS